MSGAGLLMEGSMKKYLYNYQTILHFSSPVSRHFFKLRCVPCRNACQEHNQNELILEPADVVRYDTDVWGNNVQYGSYLTEHDSFVFISCGVASLKPYALPHDGRQVDVFRSESPLASCSEEMRRWCLLPGGTARPLDQALALTEQVYHYMVYTPGSTNEFTTAPQAFSQQAGVCQDYAHILIALCRLHGIPARYVNGFLQGTGLTHAWVEVLDQDTWYGVDPTHNRMIEYGYIKLAHGRDAADCSVNRGVFTGSNAVQHAQIRVLVEEL